jgi:hypothetical protein
MTELDWSDRHRAVSLLSEHYPDRRRLEVLAAQAGLQVPPGRGFEPLFAVASRLVLSAGDRLLALLEEAGRQHEAFRAMVAPAEPPAAAPSDGETAPTEVVETLSEEAPAGGAAPDGVAPRPMGTPASAPPLQGVETWVARHIDWVAPDALVGGAAARLGLVFRAPTGEAVGGAPAGHMAYVGESFPIDVELTVLGGTPPELRQTLRCDPIAATTELAFDVTPSVDAEELDVVLRCFSGGYEVGRGRFVHRLSTGERTSGGALAVPDSVLDAINEDAIKTVQGQDA